MVNNISTCALAGKPHIAENDIGNNRKKLQLKIVHIITGLNNGGAEGVLFRLVVNDKKHEHIVVSLMGEGKYGPKLSAAGVEVKCLGMTQGRLRLGSLIKLWRFLRGTKPEIVQTWMYHADLVGGVVARLAGIKNIFWNIRHTDLEPGESTSSTIWIAHVCARLSRYVPVRIICCAEKALEVHSALGYNRNKMQVISNGYDLSLFKPDLVKVDILKTELAVPNRPLIGMVGRFNTQKDHHNLFKALDILQRRNVEFHCVLVGRDLDASNQQVSTWLEKYNLVEKVQLLGQRNDISDIMNVIDVHVLSSSFGEGFPNVLAEAMACGTPCVTTEVGDAALIVEGTGWVVPPKKPEVLAEALFKAIDELEHYPEAWETRRKECRHRVTENYGLDKMIFSYHKVWGSPFN